MLDKVFSIGLDLFAFVLPISIAATNIVFFPLAALWLFGARWPFSRWPPALPPPSGGGSLCDRECLPLALTRYPGVACD